MLYTKQKITDIKDFLQSTLEAENENYKNLIESLENGVFTLDTNLNEVETSLSLISNDPNSVLYGDMDDDDDHDDDEPISTRSKVTRSSRRRAGRDEEDMDDDNDHDDDEPAGSFVCLGYKFEL